MISEDCQRFLKTDGDVGRVPKISDEKTKKLIFVVKFMYEKYIFTVNRYDFFTETLQTLNSILSGKSKH